MALERRERSVAVGRPCLETSWSRGKSSSGGCGRRLTGGRVCFGCGLFTVNAKIGDFWSTSGGTDTAGDREMGVVPVEESAVEAFGTLSVFGLCMETSEGVGDRDGGIGDRGGPTGRHGRSDGSDSLLSLLRPRDDERDKGY